MSHTEYIWNSAGRSFMCGPNKPQRWWCSANTLSKEKQHATITWDPIPSPVFKQPDDQIHCWSLGASPLGCVWLRDVVLALCGPVPFIAAPLCNHCVPFWSFIVPLQLLHLSFWPFCLCGQFTSRCFRFIASCDQLESFTSKRENTTSSWSVWDSHWLFIVYLQQLYFAFWLLFPAFVVC